MKLSKLGFIAAAAAMVMGAGTVASAFTVANGTYTFTGTGIADLDGSYVVFTGNTITAWSMVDTAPGGNGHGLPLTQLNSSVISSGLVGNNQFFFTIGSQAGTLNTTTADFFFEGEDSPSFSFLGDKSGDPNGTWTYSTALSTTPTVPEASGTLGLFASALMALGAGKFFLRNRTAVSG